MVGVEEGGEREAESSKDSLRFKPMFMFLEISKVKFQFQCYPGVTTARSMTLMDTRTLYARRVKDLGFVFGRDDFGRYEG